MTAPTRAPSYYDPIGGIEMPPREGVPWLIDTFVSTARWFNDWLVEDVGIPVRLEAAGPSSIGFEAPGVSGVIELSADASGWLLAVARIGATEVFRGYVERAYEQCEIWPPNAGSADAEDSPGRIGKRAMWVSFRAEVWPVLAPLANELGGVNISVDEVKLRERIDGAGSAQT